MLASDLASGADEVCVRVLINGSSDDSLAVARRARDAFPGRLEVADLPVNVGAPAARNWLLQAAVDDGAEWIAYLDDDVLVPADWLSGLAAGVRDFPDAGVWGCRAMDCVSPNLAQHADGYLLDRAEARKQDDTVTLREPGVQSLVPDFQNVRRLCASVTGCCHLFRTETLAAARGFDLRFSPSQFDDFDLDLRQLQSNRPAAYLGDVAVTHLRPDFLFMELSEAGKLQAENHHSLLEALHGPQLEQLVAIQSDVLARDLAARRERLADLLHKSAEF